MRLFDLKYALSSGGPPLLESGVKSKRRKREVLELKNFKNREISFLSRIFGRMTPICIFKNVGPEVSTQTWVLSGSQRRLQRRQRSTTPADDGDCRESWFVLQPILHRWLCRLQLFIDHKMERAPINVGGQNPTASAQSPSPSSVRAFWKQSSATVIHT